MDRQLIQIKDEASKLRRLATLEKEVGIEHVSPHRDFTRNAIAKLDDGATDKQFLDFVRENYRLVLLTPEETKHLNKINRSRMTLDRLGQAGIRIVPAHSKL